MKSIGELRMYYAFQLHSRRVDHAFYSENVYA